VPKPAPPEGAEKPKGPAAAAVAAAPKAAGAGVELAGLLPNAPAVIVRHITTQTAAGYIIHHHAFFEIQHHSIV
jgi:hypothetical protein